MSGFLLSVVLPSSPRHGPGEIIRGGVGGGGIPNKKKKNKKSNQKNPNAGERNQLDQGLKDKIRKQNEGPKGWTL